MYEAAKEALEKAREKAKQLKEAGVKLYRRPLEKFIENPRIGRAVRMFCFECNGYSQYAATNCETKSCPIWLFRKGKHTPDPEELEDWQKAYAEHMKQTGEFSGASKDIDEIEDIDDDLDAIEEDEDSSEDR